MQHNLSQVAGILSISITAVYYHKAALEKEGFIKRIKGTLLYERGENAKYLEEIAFKTLVGGTDPHPSDGKEEKAPLPPDPQPRKRIAPEPPMYAKGPSDTPVVGAVDVIRAHMNGCVQYEVDKVGDRELLTVGLLKVPMLEPKAYNVHHGSEFYKGRLKFPGKDWEVAIELQVTETRNILRVWPPEVLLTRDDLERDPEARRYPQQFFSRDVTEIVHLLEKYGGWRFRGGADGRPVGKVTGQVEFAYSNPAVNRTIPEGVTGIQGRPEVWIDKSPGYKEIESSQLRNTKALLTAGEHFDALDGQVGTLANTVKSLDKEIGELDLELLLKIKTLYERLNRVVDVQDRSMKVEDATKKTNEVKSAKEDSRNLYA